MNMPVENLLAPTALRQVAWSPPEPLSLETVSAALLKESARVWQIKETAQLVLDSFHDSERKLELILASENDVKTSSDDLT
jgi:ribonuclease D